MSLGIFTRRFGAVIAVASVLIAGAVAVPSAAVAADVPAAPTYPPTVSADALPTVQIDNGVIWASKIVGDTVYVGGEFSNARPAGAAAGTNLSPRGNILAFDIKTGVLTPFAPMLNGKVNDIAASPDGKRLYVVGTFTQVDGQPRNRIAVFDLPSGTLSTTVVPNINGVTQSVAATNTTVYVGGYFSAVNGSSRARIAAVRATNGSLLPFRPVVDNGMVQALVVSPDETAVVMGGSFTSVAGGQNNPGYGLARVDATTGAQLSLPVNSEVRNAGPNSGVTSLKSDGANFYGVGWHYGPGGNMEGSFSANWTDGSLKWIEDCHGDTYDIAPAGNVVYMASHKHYCGNSGGFPQTSPIWSFYHSTAVTKTVEGTNTADIYGYPGHPGTPRPEILNWYPQTDVGTYTGKSQAVWTVDGNDDYVIYGGEFGKVNGTPQYGLVRYTVRSQAPNKQGPRFLRDQTSWAPSAISVTSGTVRVAYQTVWDRDDLDLTYRVYRDTENAAGLVDERVHSNPFWKPEKTDLKQTGLTPGSTHRYRVTATDPWGNVLRSDWVNVTVSDSSPSAYADEVLGDHPAAYWRLGEPSGSTAYDWVDGTDLTLNNSFTRGAGGAISSDSDGSTTFSGGFGATSIPGDGPNSFTVEAWINTTTTSGGKIIGFGNSATGDSSTYDRHVYMDNDGRIWFGAYPNEIRTINSTASYNDGAWHHVVASLGSDGMKLFVDGKRVAQRADTTSGQSYSGLWRIGGDNIGGWPNQPTSAYFNGRIDDVAVYSSPLPLLEVQNHYRASGRTLDVPAAPNDAYGALVYGAQPDAYWRYDEPSGADVADSGIQGASAQITGDFTRNTDGALAGSVGKSVTFNQSTCEWWQFGCTATNGGNVYSTVSFTNPTVYTLETWFKTTSSSGGKIIGFGDRQQGGSSSYDRHVYMQDDGRVVFGTWTGSANTATTDASYNDGQWHHVVATQGPDGMKLYLDGALSATNAQSQAQGYDGYWRVGGDTTWGSSSPNLVGSYDETAIYSRVLSADDVASHFHVAKGAPAPNVPPTAAFTTSVDGLRLDVDGSGSTDPDGTVASYAWDFGDGHTETGKTASHTYGSGGTFTVTLTVTDNKGATGVITTVVNMQAPNVAPTAAFVVTMDGMTANVDASASADADGQIVSYQWAFGDGATATGKTASHTYLTPGPQTVTLTVVDNDNAQSSSGQQVNAIAANQAPTAVFTSSVNALSVSVDGSGSSDPDGSIASYAWDFGDGGTQTGVATSHPYAQPGTYVVTLTVTDDRGATASSSASVTVTSSTTPGPRVLATDDFNRSVVNGWGNADQGGAWTLRGTASRFSVNQGAGSISVPSASTLYADLNSISSTSTRVDAVFSVDKLVEGQYVSVIGRRVGSNNYIARLRLQADGGVKLFLLQDGASSIAPAITVPGVTIVPGEKYVLSIQVTGNGTTQVKAKAWKQADSEPAWQREGTNTLAALQAPGAVSVYTYLPSTTQAPATVAFDKITVTEPSAG